MASGRCCATIDCMQDLIASVQKNCDISDAHHAGDSSMCIYLLRMREHYRWLNGAQLGAPLDHKSMGSWMETREEYLESLEEAHYAPLFLDGEPHDPFEHASINRRINEQGMLYCAGLGSRGKPVFCLGELVERRCDADNEIFIVGSEYAREMSAPVAMSQQNIIYVRKDAFLRMIWELVEEWSWHKPHNSFYKAISHFGSPNDSAGALAEHEVENLVLHETGEVLAGELLGDRWDDMLLGLTNTPLELSVRAVRDNLADSLAVLPRLISERNAPSIHFYFAGSHPVRDQLWPALKNAYRKWDETRAMAPFESAVRIGREHWLDTARECMDSFERLGSESLSPIRYAVESRAL